MNTEVSLNWRGPFSVDTEEGRADFSPPKKAGLYLWAVDLQDGTFQVSYVGQSGNLRDRLLQHMHYMLGGGYWLFEQEEAQRRCSFDNAYRPQQFLEEFLSDFLRFSEIARRNLFEYRFFWAEYDGVASNRKSAEDLIIATVGRHYALQNDVDRSKNRLRNDMTVLSGFEAGVTVRRFANSIKMGDLDA